MGKEIEQIALQRKHEVVLKIDVNNMNSVSREDLKKSEVAIEFSTPKSAVPNMMKCFDAGIPVVTGTTGWYDKLDEVTKICKEKNGGLFHASNFSIGVNLFFKLNRQLAKMMDSYPDYDVSMEEIHHIHKLDAPSGTAITLAEQVLENIKRKTKYSNERTSEKEVLGIVSKREGEVPGTHIVKYQSSIDDIEILHKAHSRKGFAMGAVLAAEFLRGKKGIFGMNDLLEL